MNSFYALLFLIYNILNPVPRIDKDYQTTIKATSATVRVWDEVEFTINAPIDGEATPIIYKLPPQAWKMEYGGLEFALQLHSQPATNTFVFPIQSSGLKFYRQEGVVDGRPDDVVDSYAVYHESKANFRYKTGKAFHIYRPYATDANGTKIWGDMWIDEHTLTITLPQDFLINAKYPVVLDPSLGFTSPGGTKSSLSPNFQVGHGNAGLYTMPSNGTGANIFFYSDTFTFADQDTTAGIFNASSSLPTTIVSGSLTASGTWGFTSSASWKSKTCTGSPALINGSSYFIVMNHSVGSQSLYEDTVTGGVKYESATYSAGTLVSPMSSLSNIDIKTSIYIDYTTGGGSTPQSNFFMVMGQ